MTRRVADIVDEGEVLGVVAGVVASVALPANQTAATVPFTPVGTIAATDVQAAIAEVAAEAAGGADDQTAAEVPITDAGGYFTGTNVETALQELGAASGASATQYLHVRDEKTSGTNAGTFTSGAWQTRTLNTVRTNGITGASLASNTITLPAGTYEVDASAPVHAVNAHQARLYNVTGAAVLIVGTSEYANTVGNAMTRSFVQGRFTLAVSSDVRLEHRCGTTSAGTYGFGQAASFGTEVYAELQLRKIS